MKENQKTLVEQFKSLLPILALVALLGGFYYTTQHRLGNLENQVNDLNNEVHEISGQIKQLKRKSQGQNK